MEVIETHYRFDGLQVGQFRWELSKDHFAYAILMGDNSIASLTLNYDNGTYVILSKGTES